VRRLALRILMVSTFPPRRCGIGDYTQDLVQELAKRSDITLTVLTYDDKPGSSVEVPENFELGRDLESRTTPGRVRETLRRLDPDAIHFQSSTFLHSLSVNSSVAKGSEWPLVVTAHDAPRSWRLFYTIPSLRSVYERSSCIITHSSEVSRTLARFHHVVESKLVQVPLGVDTSRFRPDVSDKPFRKAHSLGDRRILLFFGFLRPGKGLEVLLDAWSRVEMEFPDALLLIAGGIPSRTRRYALLLRNEAHYLAELGALAKKLGIFQRVLFVDYVSEVLLPSMLASASAVVLPYSVGSQSAVLPKALSSGRPVIATRIPGFLEFIREGESALFAAPGDTQTLASALRTILTDSRLANGLGRNGRKIAETRLSWPRVASQIAEVYSRVLR
jgi:glycosyltransferase involved in cell wall biosynthesis